MLRGGDHDAVPSFAIAADSIFRPHGGPRPLRELFEHGVSRRVAIEIIDLFEVIHVTEQQGQRGTLRLRFPKGTALFCAGRMGIVAGATNLELILQSLSGPGNVWNPGIFPDICAQLRKEAAIADCMAVGELFELEVSF